MSNEIRVIVYFIVFILTEALCSRIFLTKNDSNIQTAPFLKQILSHTSNTSLETREIYSL